MTSINGARLAGSDGEPGMRPVVQLTLIPAKALEALVAGDVARAGSVMRQIIPPGFLDKPRLWSYRLDQIQSDPSSAPWLARTVFGLPARAVVGMAGFHGPPDLEGMVEIGYTILPEYRRQGYGRAAVIELLAYAAGQPGVTRVRASISPNNDASLALVRGLDFVHTGEQWDEEDGRELIFERPLWTRAQPEVDSKRAG